MVTDDSAKTKLENMLKETKILLDAKKIFTTFIANHKIQHAEAEVIPPAPSVVEGAWMDNIVLIQNKVSLNSDKTQIDVFFKQFYWQWKLIWIKKKFK